MLEDSYWKFIIKISKGDTKIVTLSQSVYPIRDYIILKLLKKFRTTRKKLIGWWLKKQQL